MTDRRLHWCKTFLARINGGDPQGQVTLDNVVAPEAFHALSQRELPARGQIMTRQFALIRPI